MNGQCGSLHDIIAHDKPRSCVASTWPLDIPQSSLFGAIRACRVRVGSVRASVATVHEDNFDCI